MWIKSTSSYDSCVPHFILSEIGRVWFALVWFWSQLSLAPLLSGLVLVSAVPGIGHDLVLVSVVVTTTLLWQIRQYDIQVHIYREEILTIFIITYSIWDGWSNSGIRHLSSESLWKKWSCVLLPSFSMDKFALQPCGHKNPVKIFSWDRNVVY